MSYICPKCGRELKYKKTLKRHLNGTVKCCQAKWPCPKCGRVFETSFQLRGHLSACGVKRKKRGSVNVVKCVHKKNDLTCPYCLKKFETGAKKGGHMSGCKLNPKYEQNLATRRASQLKANKSKHGKHLTEATKEKMRKARFEYIKALNGKATGGWKRRQQGKMSYLEARFYDNVIVKHNLLEKYDIVNEYPEYPYFIDFAFLNVKLAVELDGKQHFAKQEQIKHDKKREAILINKGWKIFRIAYYELTKEKVQTVLATLSNVEDYKPKQLAERLLKFSEHKPKLPRRTQEECWQQLREKHLLLQTDKIKLVKNSSIDFSKYGWSGKVAKLTNIKHQKVSQWMQVCCPNIWSSAFHRKETKV